MADTAPPSWLRSHNGRHPWRPDRTRSLRNPSTRGNASRSASLRRSNIAPHPCGASNVRRARYGLCIRSRALQAAADDGGRARALRSTSHVVSCHLFGPFFYCGHLLAACAIHGAFCSNCLVSRPRVAHSRRAALDDSRTPSTLPPASVAAGRFAPCRRPRGAVPACGRPFAALPSTIKGGQTIIKQEGWVRVGARLSCRAVCDAAPEPRPIRATGHPWPCAVRPSLAGPGLRLPPHRAICGRSPPFRYPRKRPRKRIHAPVHRSPSLARAHQPHMLITLCTTCHQSVHNRLSTYPCVDKSSLFNTLSTGLSTPWPKIPLDSDPLSLYTGVVPVLCTTDGYQHFPRPYYYSGILRRRS